MYKGIILNVRLFLDLPLRIMDNLILILLSYFLVDIIFHYKLCVLIIISNAYPRLIDSWWKLDFLTILTFRENIKIVLEILFLSSMYFYICSGYVFLPTYIVAIILSALLILHVFTYGYHIYIGRFFCGYVLYRYLSLAFSNPGLAR